MEPTRSNDIPSKRGFSDCYSWLPSDYYLLPGAIPIYQKLLEQLNSPLGRVGKGFPWRPKMRDLSRFLDECPLNIIPVRRTCRNFPIFRITKLLEN